MIVGGAKIGAVGGGAEERPLDEKRSDATMAIRLAGRSTEFTGSGIAFLSLGPRCWPRRG
jgi:hypothetical protein